MTLEGLFWRVACWTAANRRQQCLHAVATSRLGCMSDNMICGLTPTATRYRRYATERSREMRLS